MANYDYNLEDAENAAVNKSKNLKRAAVVGGAVLGAGAVGAASAYGATHINPTPSPSSAGDNNELSSDDILEGGKAMTLEGAEEVIDTPEETSQTVINETHIHIHPEPVPEPPVAEPVIDVADTNVVLDQYGNPVDVYDSGTIDGKDFVVLDLDGNGMGDVLAYDENGNGVFEQNEIYEMDNRTYEIGHGDNLTVHQVDEYGNSKIIAREENPYANRPLMAQNDDDISDIHNDFLDEKTGEVYRDDLAENNPDYNNRTEAEQYRAGMDGEPYTHSEEIASVSHDGEQFEEFTAQTDVSSDMYPEDTYVENSYTDDTYGDEMAFDDTSSTDSFDEAATFDA